jgi:curved DNA-binding protein CbpA
LSDLDPYKVLQVDSEAEREVIEAAYRRLARKYHPDVSPDPESHEKMIAINQAWEQLRDPVKRAAVDRARIRSHGTVAWVAASDAQARTAGTAAGPARQPASQRTPSAPRQPAYVPPPVAPRSPAMDPQRAGSASAGSASTWPLGMSDPAASHASADSQPGTRSWSTGRVPTGGAQPGARSRPEGEGAAGPPPGNPAGSVLNFGRYAGWSLGEIARTEIDYLEWLDRMPIGRTYQAEIDGLLRARRRRTAGTDTDQGRGGPFRRR